MFSSFCVHKEGKEEKACLNSSQILLVVVVCLPASFLLGFCLLSCFPHFDLEVRFPLGVTKYWQPSFATRCRTSVFSQTYSATQTTTTCNYRLHPKQQADRCICLHLVTTRHKFLKTSLTPTSFFPTFLVARTKQVNSGFEWKASQTAVCEVVCE